MRLDQRVEHAGNQFLGKFNKRDVAKAGGCIDGRIKIRHGLFLDKWQFIGRCGKYPGTADAFPAPLIAARLLRTIRNVYRAEMTIQAL